MSILVVAEICGLEVGGAVFSTVNAAKALSAINGASFDVLVLGKGAEEAAAGLKCFGAANVYFSDDDTVTEYTAEAYASAVATVVWDKGHKAVMAPDTANGKDLIPKLAWLMNSDMVNSVAGFDPDGYLSPIYPGNRVAKVTTDSVITFMTVREKAFNRAKAKCGEKEAAVTEAFFTVDGCCFNADYDKSHPPRFNGLSTGAAPIATVPRSQVLVDQSK